MPKNMAFKATKQLKNHGAYMKTVECFILGTSETEFLKNFPDPIKPIKMRMLHPSRTRKLKTHECGEDLETNCNHETLMAITKKSSPRTRMQKVMQPQTRIQKVMQPQTRMQSSNHKPECKVATTNPNTTGFNKPQETGKGGPNQTLSQKKESSWFLFSKKKLG